MPNSEVFLYVYQVTGGTPGAAINVGQRFDTGQPNSSGPYTLQDGRDGINDGSTTLGDLLFYIDSSGTYQARIIALTDSGDPVIQFLSGGGTWIISNDPGLLQGGTVNTIATGAYVYCFLPGTLIGVPGDAVAVEHLAIGDLVKTADGRAVPVRWIGRQTLSTLSGSAGRLVPVRVREGALGNGLPLRDLVVTADHALVIDGLLVNAGALVNGSTVTEVPASKLPERVTVYHVETEAHEVILAEGTPAETFIDYAGRRVFDNYADYVALYGEERGIVENPAPRVTCARMLPPALKARLGISRAA